MKYPGCCKGGMVLLTALSLGACPVAEPSVVYDEPVAGAVASSGARFQLAGSSASDAAGVGATDDDDTAGAAGHAGGAGGSKAASAGAGGSKAADAGAGGSEAAGAGGNEAAGAGAGAGGSEAAGAGAAGNAAGSGGMDGSGAGTQPFNVSFSVTTAAPGGKYQPKNIGAIWIETPSSDFVKTLELWAKTRRRYLTKYNSTVGTTGGVDVTASATLSNHITHHVSWDHRDRSGALRDPGAFRLCLELTDADVTGPYYCLDFDTSEGTQTLTPADQRCFKSLTLTVE